MFDSLKVANDEMQKARAKFKADAADLVKPAFREMFEACPSIEAVRWRQYTPYFNDGDACVFRVGDHYLKFTGDKKDEAEGDDDDGDYEDGFSSTYGLTGEKEAAAAIVSELFRCLDDEMMLTAFEDHAKITATREGFEITATREGFEVEEYDHD